jgi:phosphatidate cytidylyltransferase
MTILRVPGDTGRNLLLTVLGLTVLYDVCAYAIGSLWGNRPLAPTISPKKSWEGAVGATFVLLLVALAIVPSVEPFTAARAVGLALVIAVTATLGDLVESALKRDLGLKDMGSLLPGHGGVLDRVDSILFAAPAAWYFLRLVIL